ncbi:glutathione biosynthesis bifunctional protein GshAB [Paenibacillus sp. NAIST15-1]|nr:glutathione biosynthesis bifunctional protein GshAB [Paenibacillus sp. NAIST15-1]
MLLKEDEPFGMEDQKMADLNHDQMIAEGIEAILHDSWGSRGTLKEMALTCIREMQEMVQLLNPYGNELTIHTRERTVKRLRKFSTCYLYSMISTWFQHKQDLKSRYKVHAHRHCNHKGTNTLSDDE